MDSGLGLTLMQALAAQIILKLVPKENRLGYELFLPTFTSDPRDSEDAKQKLRGSAMACWTSDAGLRSKK